jgi:hypothetical protein
LAIKEGSLEASRYLIMEVNDECMKKGYCPLYAFNKVEKLYKGYKTLGGNGTIDQAMEDLKSLPRQNFEKR